MALNNNACPICDELSVYYGVAFNAYNMVHGNQPDITLTEDICNKLSMGMPVHICNHGEILMLYPLYETMTGTGQCAYILIGSIGSTS